MNCMTALKRLREEQQPFDKPSDRVRQTPEFQAGYRVGWANGVADGVELLEENECPCTEGLMDNEEDY